MSQGVLMKTACPSCGEAKLGFIHEGEFTEKCGRVVLGWCNACDKRPHPAVVDIVSVGAYEPWGEGGQ